MRWPLLLPAPSIQTALAQDATVRPAGGGELEAPAGQVEAALELPGPGVAEAQARARASPDACASPDV